MTENSYDDKNEILLMTKTGFSNENSNNDGNNDVENIDIKNVNKNDDMIEKNDVDSDEENNIKENKEENVANIEDNYKENRKWIDRYLSSITPGSIRASIFSLSILSIGTGCLSLPQRFAQLSVILSIILIFLAGFAAYWTLNLLIFCSLKTGEMTYSKIIKKILSKNWSTFLDITLIIYIFGVLIIYQIVSK